jgi:ketosteroid isomerase-like protein
MKRTHFIFTIILIGSTIFIFCCNAQTIKHKASLAEVKTAIEKSNALYFEAFVKGNSSIFVDRYAKDCCIMPPNTPAMCSVDSPLDFFRVGYKQMGVRNGKFITTEIFGDGEEFVTEVGLFKLFNSKNTMIENGKYLVLWKKTPNGWKMFRDSFSSNNPLKLD